MADFVAVIRKAVDGLANNTPENRAKVYDKARSAVVRQLENMKPRPPEELLRRQIAKLDAAIAEVDSEYAEALPALEDDDAVSPAAEETAASYYQQDTADEDEARAAEPAEDADREEARHEPAYEEPASAEPAQSEPAYEEAAEEEEPRHADAAADEEPHRGDREPEELYDAPETVHVAPAPAHASDEAVGTYFTRTDEEPAHQPEPETALGAADDSVPSHWAQPVDEDDWRKLDEAQDDDVRPAAEEYEEVRNETDERPLVAGYAAQHYQEPEVSFEPAPYEKDERREADDHFGPAAVEHAPAFGGRHDFDDHRQPEEQAPKKAAVVEDFSSYFQDADIAIPAKDAPALPRADNDLFGDQAAAKDNKERTPWDDLDELIGYDGASSSTRQASGETNGMSAAAATPAYMVKKKPRRNYASLVLALVGVALLAGGGYAVWMNRDALNDMVGGLVSSAQNGGTSQTASNGTGEAQTSTPPATQQPPATGQQPTTPTNHQAPTHGDDGSVTGTKFTQRLLADGTERDEGPAAGANGQPVTAEGQSVYEQNVAPPPAGEAPANNAGAPAGTPAGTPPAQQPAAAAGDRMFLYEEVLGQTVPTAIQGSVSWSLQQENDGEGKPSPTVQGQITVPGRGLSALITFKRNTDPSLPASHLIEIVFSVSPGFEGGAIDSVQRIAMKSTEQDRGNALIAVPAKITDDFHMIALNDFPDAMKTNLELLKSRNWIDIPVSYRNGRRALLTLQKGNDGIAAFDKALSEWAAATPATGQ
ncbi:hypothetical protein G6M84_10010 [Agrobacterium tumefaciens]|uniref:hypothetical protein n=1 Tax=Agrobacterium tumefaciens TaxID=358 RepID=UPI001574A71E|nr:hypothetical protein [Agrobacterium tumefaciens]NTB96851.1 hypothetical protein [Agrobacterium tumefaciens]NTC44234.1 hypothetical protein [Agrobacterium tumefaciens]